MTTASQSLGESSGRRARGGLLRQRDFRLLWIGETTSKLGTSISTVAVPLVAIATLHASAFLVSVIIASIWAPWLLVGLPAGAWVDRLPTRSVMLTCDAVSLLSFVSVPVAALAGVLTIWHVLIAALLVGTSAVFFETAFEVYLPSLLRTADLTEGNAKLQGSFAAAGIAGPGVGGLIAQAFGAVWGLFANALAFGVSAICLLFIGHPAGRKAPVRGKSTLSRDIADGIRFVARDAYLRTMTIYGAAANFAINGFTAILLVFMIRELRVSPGMAGVAMAGISLGSVLGAASAGWVIRRFGTARGLLLSRLLIPFALFIPLAKDGFGVAVVGLAGLVVALGVMIGVVIQVSFRQEYCPRPILGRIVVSMQFLNYGAIPVGAVTGGGLSTLIGVRPTMWAMTAAVSLTGLILVLSPIRKHRDLPAAPVTAG